MCLCAEGIWCDGGKCVCVLRAAGVMGEAMVVCFMRACGCVLRALCDGGSCRRISGVMEDVVRGSLV